jgi:ribokinase
MRTPPARPVLIDTDPGIDDAFALALACNSPELDVRIVTTVAGNADINTVTRNAALLLPLFDAPASTQLVRGASKPRRGPLRDAKNFHGIDGLGGWTEQVKHRPLTHAVSGSRAAQAIASAAREFGPDLIVIALGPLTNIARAIDLDAQAMRGLGRLIVMGGAVRTAGNVTALCEFNFYADPVAAQFVLGNNLPLTLVPLDVTHQVRLPPEVLRAALDGRRDPIARAMRVMAKHAYRRQPRGFALHDPLAVAMAIEPSLVEVEVLPLDLLTSPSQAAGTTVEDRRPLTDGDKVGAWTHTATKVDATRALALFSERVLSVKRARRPHRVAVVGGLNMDYVVRGANLPRRGETVTGDSLSTFPGGKGANQAVAAARAGAGVTLIGRVGDDSDGEALLQALNADGVQLEPRVPAKEHTGVALINVDAKGQNQISVAPGANRALSIRQVRAAAQIIASAKVLLCQFEAPANALHEALRIARKHGTYTVLNPSPVRALSKQLPGCIDLLIANEVEAQAFTGLPITSRAQARTAAAALQAIGFAGVVITLGARGALWSAAGSSGFQAAHRVAALDTTAAGDTFAGYVAASIARGSHLSDAVKHASAAAALSVQRVGAQPSIPSAAEVAQQERRSARKRI